MAGAICAPPQRQAACTVERTAQRGSLTGNILQLMKMAHAASMSHRIVLMVTLVG